MALTKLIEPHLASREMLYTAVNAAETTPWIPMTLQNGWSTVSPFRCVYRKVLGFLFIEAVATGGAVEGAIFATLPVGYRVASPVIVPCAGPTQTITTSSTRAIIYSDGNITLFGVSGVGTSAILHAVVSLQ